MTHIPPGGIVHTQTQDPWLAWWRLYMEQALLCITFVFCYQQMKLVSIVIAAHAARGRAGVQRELMQPTAKLTKLNPSANF
jgi:hypothetical protein